MSHQKLDWIPIREQPNLPESGFYLLTLKDDMFPEDASWRIRPLLGICRS